MLVCPPEGFIYAEGVVVRKSDQGYVITDEDGMNLLGTQTFALFEDALATAHDMTHYIGE